MKTRILFFSALIALFFYNNSMLAQSTNPIEDTIFMGAGYVNEIYYSMANGEVGQTNRKLWDIAFRTSRMSASILANDAANDNALGITGVELYAYPTSDTSGWQTFDTTGFYAWKNLVNSTTDWETGAFDQNQLGHPDYGWGKYNTATHDVVGDSLFLIKLRDGSFRKLWIIRKYSSLNEYAFRYANIDGSNEHTIMLDCSNFTSRNFLGYSLITDQVIDFEPVDSFSWDILFTKYMYTYPDGVLYPVTGILSNYGVKVNKFEHVAPDFIGYNISTMDSTRSPIGWEWKYFDMENNVFEVVDSLVYFVLDRGGSIYKLTFKDFAGSSSGRVVLEKELIKPSGISDNLDPIQNVAVYPNPASSETNLLIDAGDYANIKVRVSDLSGLILFQSEFPVNRNSLNNIKLPLSAFHEGVYVVSCFAGNLRSNSKLIVQH